MAYTIANIKGFSKFIVKDLLTIRVADLVRCVGALAADAAHWLRAIAGERPPRTNQADSVSHDQQGDTIAPEFRYA